MIPLCDETASLFQTVPLYPFDRIEVSSYPDDTRYFILDPYYISGTTRSRAGDGVYDFLEKIPACKAWKNIGSYDPRRAPVSDTTVEMLLQVIGRNHLAFGDPQAFAQFQLMHMQSLRADRCAEASANYKLHGTIPEHCISLHPEFPLKGYQQVALLNALDLDGYGLFMEQGTGKTPVGIAAMDYLADPRFFQYTDLRGRPRPCRVIVMAPKNVRYNWADEIQKFGLRTSRVTVMEGTAIQRYDQLVQATAPGNEELQVVVSGYESISNTWEALSLIDWDLAIADEGQGLCNAKTVRVEYAHKLRDKSNKRLILSGTPQRNSLSDLWAVFEFMGQGYSGFATVGEFNKFFRKFDVDINKPIAECVANLPVMRERVARYTSSYTKKEVLPELPEKVYDTISVDMAPDQDKIYKQAATQLAVEIEHELSRTDVPRSMIMQNVLVMLQKLSQITSGFIIMAQQFDAETDELLFDKEVRYFSRNPKIEAMLDLMLHPERDPNGKTIVWTQFVPALEYISHALTTCGIEHVTYYGKTTTQQRIDNERRYNCDPNCKVFVGIPRAGGTGLNLLGYDKNNPDHASTYTDHVINYDEGWSGVEWGQKIDRAHRIGMRCNLRVTDLVVPKSIDVVKKTRIAKKVADAITVADVRDILEFAVRA